MKCKTIIIVDDEPAARRSLKTVIDDFSELKVIAQLGDGKSAIEQITMLKPDIVFLDIEMPEINGFDVAKATRHLDYQLVFLTAYEHYALQAFETNAIDYMVKPARPELIRKSINKILRQEDVALNKHENEEDSGHLVLNDYQQQKVVAHSHINFIEGIGRYRRIHLTEPGCELHNSETIICDMTLDELSSRLPENAFYRLHRSYIINSARILQLTAQSRRHFVRLAGTETLIPVSRSFLTTLKQHLDDLK